MSSRSICSRILSVVAFGSSGLLGCTIPDFPDEHFISVQEVVDRVQCELWHARMAYGPELDLWQGAAGLTLRVERNIGADASVDWVVPIRDSNVFKFGPLLGLSNSVKREGNLKFDVQFKRLSEKQCPYYLASAGAFRAYGDFGLTDWISRAMSATDARDQTTTKEFDYTLDFGVKLNARGTPGFSIVNLSGSSGLTADRTDTHVLTVTFTKIGIPEPEKPQLVCVTNMPGAKPCDPKKVAQTVPSRLLFQRLDLLRLRDQFRR